MSNRFTCAMNGVAPESLDPAIRVTDLTEMSPRMRVQTQPAAGHGLRVLKQVRESLTVRISLIIAEYDPAARREALQKLNAWAARGGWLTVSDRPGQRLRIDYCTLPAMCALGWTDEIQLECTAYTVPFWEAVTENAAAVTSGGVLTLPGSAEDCPVSCDVVNTGGGALTTVTLTCGGTSMTFEGLEIQPGEFLRVSATGGGVLSATAGDVSVLMRRTAGSHDLLLADAGASTAVAVTADQSVSATFRARGRYV